MLNTIIVQLFVVYVTGIAGYYCPVPSSPHTANLNQVPNYYWRDYVGVIPEDAIQGGTDDYGRLTYVGQAYFEKFQVVLPVIIYVGCKSANATIYASEVTTDKNIKILCGKYKENFEWVVTKNEETHLLTNRILIEGGYEGSTLYIGRVQYSGKTVSGKVFSYPLSNRGLWIPDNNGTPINFLSYEILTFNVNKKYGCKDIIVS